MLLKPAASAANRQSLTNLSTDLISADHAARTCTPDLDCLYTTTRWGLFSVSRYGLGIFSSPTVQIPPYLPGILLRWVLRH